MAYCTLLVDLCKVGVDITDIKVGVDITDIKVGVDMTDINAGVDITDIGPVWMGRQWLGYKMDTIHGMCKIITTVDLTHLDRSTFKISPWLLPPTTGPQVRLHSPPLWVRPRALLPAPPHGPRAQDAVRRVALVPPLKLRLHLALGQVRKSGSCMNG